MRFSRFAGVSIVPLLARLVLFAAFFAQGYYKVFDEVTYEGQDAMILARLGVGDPVVESSSSALQRDVHLAHYQVPTGNLAGRGSQDQPPPDDADPDADPADEPPGDEPAADDPVTDDEDPAAEEPAAQEPLPAEPRQPPRGGTDVPAEIDEADEDGRVVEPGWNGEPIEARKLHQITLMLVSEGYEDEWRPEVMAWAAALTEMLGGGFILLGLFSRFWAVGLAGVMAVAYYITSWEAPFADPNMFQLASSAENIALYNRLFTQLGLFVLAFGIVLTGPGALSLDRLFFRRRTDVVVE